MENGWYYASDDKKLGPYSQQQLKELAGAGTILRTDTIWKGGVAQGVLADRVKNLFPAILPVAPPMPTFDEVDIPRLVPLVPFVDMQTEEARVIALLSAPVVPPIAVIPAVVPTPKVAPPERAKHPPQGRATAISGAIIVSQDGTRAKYRMVCKPCGHQDSSCQSLTITNKSFKRNFFCPKCRKRRDVAIQCQLR